METSVFSSFNMETSEEFPFFILLIIFFLTVNLYFLLELLFDTFWIS